MIGPELETSRPPTGPGFSDAVTFAFGDLRAGIFGLARVGIAPGDEPGALARGSALALLFERSRLVAEEARGDVELAAPGWAAIEVGAVRATTAEPLTAWRVELAGESDGFALDFAALAPAAALGGAVEGYEQLCHVQGEARIGGESIEIDCLGQRGHTWGAPDWERIAAVRTVCAWLGPDLALLVRAVRPAAAPAHGDDAISAVVIDGAGPGAALVDVPGARLSTTYDAAGRPRAAGLELPVAADDEDGFTRRAAGEALCGGSLELGRLALDTAFFLWRMEGRVGVGRYELLRRTEA